MKKVWGFLTFLFAGFAGGIIIAIKYLVPEKTVFKGMIKLKQRGEGNTQLTDIRPDITAETRREERKAKRKERKDGRAVAEKDS